MPMAHKIEESTRRIKAALVEKQEQDYIEENKRYKQALAAKRDAYYIAERERMARIHIKSDDGKGNQTTYYDDLLRQSIAAIEGEHGYVNPLACMSLMLAIARALNVAERQALSNLGVYEGVGRLIAMVGDKICGNKLNPKSSLDVLKYHIHFDGNEVKLDPLTIHGAHLPEQWKSFFNGEFKKIVQTWLSDKGYEPSKDNPDIYVSKEPPHEELTQSLFEQLNQNRGASLDHILNSEKGLKFEPRDTPRPSIRP